MINIIGLVIIAVGFFLPYLVDARVPYTIFFWIGGLLSLNKGMIIQGHWRWARWAQIGILINIALFIGMNVTTLLIGEGTISKFQYWLSMLSYWISSPATAIGQQIFPYPETHYQDGSVLVHISLLQSIITSFLNIAIFAFVSALSCILLRRDEA